MSGTPQTCVYPDVCLGIAHVSGKAPLAGQGGLADTQCICPFRPKESVGQKGADTLCIYHAPCPERGALPDTWAIPKHTSGVNTGLGVPNHVCGEQPLRFPAVIPCHPKRP